MILWMLWSLLFAALVGLAALAGESIAAFFGVPRRFVWMTAIAVAAVGPVVIATHRVGAAPEPMVLLSVPPDQTGAPRPIAGTATDRQTADVAAGPGPTIVPSVAPPMTGASLRRAMTSQAATRWAERLWLLTSLISSLAFLRALAILRRRSSAWRDAEIGPCRALVAPDAGPAVIGFARPQIVIPEWMLSLERSAQDLMLRHEMEHIRAGDPRALLAAGTALVVFPWNAALWWLVRRLRTAMELDCDARVIRAVGGPRAYGMVLLAVGERYTMPLPLAASLVEPRSLLERRIRAMTTPRPRRPLLVSLPFAAIALLAVTAASGAPRPAALRLFAGHRAQGATPSSADRLATVPTASKVATTAPMVETAGTPDAPIDRPVAVDPVGNVPLPLAVLPVKRAAPDCDSLRAIITDNFAADLSAFDATPAGPDKAMNQYVVLVYDANNDYVRGLYGSGTLGLRVGGDTRPISERPGEDDNEQVCGRPMVNGQPAMGGRGGGAAGGAVAGDGSGSILRRLLAADSSPVMAGGGGGGRGGRAMTNTDSLQPLSMSPMNAAGGRAQFVTTRVDSSGVALFAVMGLDQPIAAQRRAVPAGACQYMSSGCPGSTSIVNQAPCSWNGSQTMCYMVSLCCAPWHIAPFNVGPFAALVGVGRNVVDDTLPGSYVLGVETIRRNPPGAGGSMDYRLFPPNQGEGFTMPVQDSSGIAGIPAANVASVDRLRFAMGQLSSGPLTVFIVNLTPGAPHQY